MPLAKFLLIVVASAVATIAAPGKVKFSVSQTRNPGYVEYATSGQAALEKVYAKFGKPMPAVVASAVKTTKQKFKKGSITNQPQAYDSAYLCQVSIGTPKQKLFLDFDTGSADLWVFSSETPSAEVNRQAIYKPNSSTTSKKLEGATWSILYGDGTSANGDVYLDKINIGGVKVQSQAIESAQSVSEAFTTDSSNSGLLGLGFGSLNSVKPNQQTTFFDNVKNVLAAPIFVADLNYEAFGSYTFGYIDKTRVTGPAAYTPVNNSDGYWAITASGYTINNGTFQQTPINGIVDTGTSLFLLPDDIVQDYYQAVVNSTYSTVEGGWVFPCYGDADYDPIVLPDFSFRIGSYDVVVPGTYINYAPVTDGSEDGYYCFSGIQPDTGIGFSILGDVALKSHLVVFDGGNIQVGFAPKKL